MEEPKAWKVRRTPWTAAHRPERIRLQYREGRGQAEGRCWKPHGHSPVLLVITVTAKMACLLEMLFLAENPASSWGFSSSVRTPKIEVC